MFLSRIFGRTLFAAAKSETSAATAAAASAARNPLEEFFEADRSVDDDKPVVYGRSWKASELRLKSWDDLHKLWYVLLKEKNMLMTQRQMLHAQNLRFPNPERVPKNIPLLKWNPSYSSAHIRGQPGCHRGQRLGAI
ncbi:39S ribosomal protein L47, mitochondrial isoform X2 [Juglans microcarpa x Juglans regia]|uniref:39S ribosomal protein L47, mitochondrial isoform X2 n=1 Tax=Juglans microcarpa x Juglans regia TaxID=2249226 RepID=UPI001B7F5DEC|nr:39S ribosomal protein L47, mitochondrial isoform X2 [Juglans microcarpa x Juglans regia]